VYLHLWSSATKSAEEYDSKLKDAYRYEVAGGLHSYTAKKELAEEYPQNPFYKSVEASVYAGLTDEQALRLALRNGRWCSVVALSSRVSAAIVSLSVSIAQMCLTVGHTCSMKETEWGRTVGTHVFSNGAQY